MQHVLLFGATGFIGQRLQQRLLQGGYRVRAVVRPESKHLSNLHPDIEAVPAALDDRGRISDALQGIDSVIYAAGTVRGACYEDFLPANVAGVAALADVLQRGPERPLLHLSSIVATRPDISWYGRSKAAGEEVLRQRRLPWTILRPPAVYGPGEQELMPLLKTVRRGLVPIPGSTDQRLSVLHVDDLTQAVAAWLGNPAACREGCFGLDDGHIVGYDWGQIAQAIAPGAHYLLPIPSFALNTVARVNLSMARLFGYAPMLTPGKVQELRAPDWVCDNAEFTDVTGWEPDIDLAYGARALFG